MAETFVALSDLLITLECAVCAVLLFGTPERYGIRSWVVAFFAAAAVSALLGALTHGLFADASGDIYRVFWKATMLAIGFSAMTAYAISVHLLGLCRSWVWLAVMAFGVYVWDVFFISDDFRAAVAFYAPASVLMLAGFLARYLRERETAALTGAAAVLVGLVGAWVQQSGVDLQPVYLTHNTLYHLIQALSFYGLFIAFRGLARRP